MEFCRLGNAFCARSEFVFRILEIVGDFPHAQNPESELGTRNSEGGPGGRSGKAAVRRHRNRRHGTDPTLRHSTTATRSEVICGGPTDIFPELDYETESAFFRHYFGTFSGFFEFKK
jgi:hypothetical protein